MFKTINKCRICGQSKLDIVMSLGSQVLTGVFPKSKDVALTAGPVDLVKCSAENGCGLVQLKQSYNLDEMYGMNYGYRSGLNSSMVRHLHSKVEKILAMNLLKPGDLIVDIGSNDATTLKAYPQNGYDFLGVDPTGVKFKDYYPENIKLVPDFFSANAVLTATGGKKAKIVTSFSMYYDLEDPVEFARQIENCLTDDGVWIFEQSYLPSMLRTNSFDTICHEHLEFYALKQILWIAKAAKLKVIDVEFNDINGGSFSITAAKENSALPVNQANISAILASEIELGLDSTRAFEEFKARVAQEKIKFLNFLQHAKSEGKSVYGLGASTKGNVLLQYYGVGSELIAAIGEVNEDKYGSFTPGSKIPLVSEAEILALNPDYLVVLPWHFRSFFLALPTMAGRRLVFPLPKFEVVDL